MELKFNFTGSTYPELQEAIEKELRRRGQQALMEKTAAKLTRRKALLAERANAFFDAADFVKSITFED